MAGSFPHTESWKAQHHPRWISTPPTVNYFWSWQSKNLHINRKIKKNTAKIIHTGKLKSWLLGADVYAWDLLCANVYARDLWAQTFRCWNIFFFRLGSCPVFVVAQFVPVITSLWSETTSLLYVIYSSSLKWWQHATIIFRIDNSVIIRHIDCKNKCFTEAL